MQHPFVNTAVKAARKAGNIIIRALDRREDLEIIEKSAHNYVTEVDKTAERTIIDILRQAYPDHGILAEETGLYEGDEYQWIIDPLDGTTNFIHGYPHFCVSIALKYKNRIEHAVVYDPIRNDIYTASRGEGAQVNNRRIRISKHQALDHAIVGTGLPSSAVAYRKQYLQATKEIMENAGGMRVAGAAALDLALVASGQLDGYWSLCLKPWDIAAGILLVQEAGGLVLDYQGSEDVLKKGHVIAGNIKLVKALIQHLQPCFSGVL